MNTRVCTEERMCEETKRYKDKGTEGPWGREAQGPRKLGAEGRRNWGTECRYGIKHVLLTSQAVLMQESPDLHLTERERERMTACLKEREYTRFEQD